MTIVEMCVHMDCSGCESKIRRALSKLKGVDSVEIDMGMQKVTVTGWAEQKKVLRAVRRTGRRAVLWPSAAAGVEGAEAGGIYTEEYYRLHGYNAGAPAAPHHLIFDADPRSYNYYKHGYGGSADAAATLYGQYRPPPPHNHIIDDGARARFSDDNPHACSIM